MKAKCVNVNAVIIILAICLLISFFYIWPGVYRYKYYQSGTQRVDKLTGCVSVYTEDVKQWECSHCKAIRKEKPPKVGLVNMLLGKQPKKKLTEEEKRQAALAIIEKEIGINSRTNTAVERQKKLQQQKTKSAPSQ